MPRRFSGFRLDVVGYMPRKTDWVDRQFQSVNYSIILSGHGSYQCDGKTWPVEAPCVITQIPDIRHRYGPLPDGSWEELFFVLPAQTLDGLMARGLFGENRYIWPIRNPAEVMRGVKTFLSLIEHPDATPGWMDRMDHRAERIVMDSLLPGMEADDPGAAMVMWLAKAMATDPGERYDFREIALEHGLSFSTFQRRWRQQYDHPPGQHLLNLRLSECCRLLVESDVPAGEIGRGLGFDNPAYFSRMFTARIGMPPSRYRSVHRPG